ncbi:MAG: DUF5606 domain-containing protein [Bacteroidales bacterium]|nr:DUF5606 domain-containing protein [Bacteroidales bacterium]
MATDLKKVLSITGQSGLFHYLAQSKNGVIVEAFATGHRSAFSGNMKMTTLADVSIYTNEDELPLKEVFRKMNAVLGEEDAPSQKSDEKVIKEFFAKAVEDYDRDRFYVSHMKKVLEWYNLLKHYASLEFVDDEEDTAEVRKDEEKPESAAKIAAAKQAKAPAKATSAKAATAKAASTKKSTKSVQRKAN